MPSRVKFVLKKFVCSLVHKQYFDGCSFKIEKQYFMHFFLINNNILFVLNALHFLHFEFFKVLKLRRVQCIRKNSDGFRVIHSLIHNYTCVRGTKYI